MTAKAVANPSYTPIPHPILPYKTFESFYPFYLGEHAQRKNRLLHLTGTSIAWAVYLRVLLSLIPVALRSLPPSNVVNKDDKIVRDLNERLSLTTKQVGRWLGLGLLQGYAFAWLGHFFVENNKPATFKYPLFSLRGDFRMLWEVLTLRRRA